MKKILIILFICSPLLVISQSKGDFLLKFNYGMVCDEFHPNGHANSESTEYLTTPNLSADMQSNHPDNDLEDVNNALQISGGYFICDNLLVGLNYMSSDIGGSNNNQYWAGSFNEKGLFTEYEFCNKYGIGFFAKGGAGRISFDSEVHKLLSDDIDIDGPLSVESDKAWKVMYGAGASYKVYKFINLNIEVSRNIVKHDGFDGWDNGTGTDRYLYTSAGLSFTIGGKNAKESKEGVIRDAHLLLPLLLIVM